MTAIDTSIAASLNEPTTSGNAAQRWEQLLRPIDALLRDRTQLLLRIEHSEQLPELARSMLVAIGVCAAVFGAAVGFYRGGVQILFAAIKLPLVILLTAAICTPALSALRAALRGNATTLLRDLALVLSCLALGSLLLAALSPMVLINVSFGIDYHALVLLVVVCCALAGTAGLALFVRGIWRAGGEGRWLATGALLLLLCTVGAQMTWVTRPYLVRPRTHEVPFIRAIEGSFVDSVSTSADSARGIYHRHDDERTP